MWGVLGALCPLFPLLEVWGSPLWWPGEACRGGWCGLTVRRLERIPLLRRVRPGGAVWDPAVVREPDSRDSPADVLWTM